MFSRRELLQNRVNKRRERENNGEGVTRGKERQEKVKYGKRELNKGWVVTKVGSAAGVRLKMGRN